MSEEERKKSDVMDRIAKMRSELGSDELMNYTKFKSNPGTTGMSGKAKIHKRPKAGDGTSTLSGGIKPLQFVKASQNLGSVEGAQPGTIIRLDFLKLWTTRDS